MNQNQILESTIILVNRLHDVVVELKVRQIIGIFKVALEIDLFAVRLFNIVGASVRVQVDLVAVRLKDPARGITLPLTIRRYCWLLGFGDLQTEVLLHLLLIDGEWEVHLGKGAAASTG